MHDHLNAKKNFLVSTQNLRLFRIPSHGSGGGGGGKKYRELQDTATETLQLTVVT